MYLPKTQLAEMEAIFKSRPDEVLFKPNNIGIKRLAKITNILKRKRQIV